MPQTIRNLVTRSVIILASALIALGAAACADDSSNAAEPGAPKIDASTSGPERKTTPAKTGTAQQSGFCDALLTLNRIDPPGEGPIPPTPAQLKDWSKTISTPFADLSAEAPGSLKGQVSSLSGAIAKAANGDGAAFDDGSIELAHEDLEEQARTECNWQSADLEASDFRFTGMPTSIKAGAFSVRLSNVSKAEPHVFLLLRKDGDSKLSNAEQVTEMVSAFDTGDPAKIAEATRNSVSGGGPGGVPGQSRTHTFDLVEGDYIYFCPIPVMSGGDGQTLHYQAGMIGELKVS